MIFGNLRRDKLFGEWDSPEVQDVCIPRFSCDMQSLSQECLLGCLPQLLEFNFCWKSWLCDEQFYKFVDYLMFGVSISRRIPLLRVRTIFSIKSFVYFTFPILSCSCVRRHLSMIEPTRSCINKATGRTRNGLVAAQSMIMFVKLCSINSSFKKFDITSTAFLHPITMNKIVSGNRPDAILTRLEATLLAICYLWSRFFSISACYSARVLPRWCAIRSSEANSTFWLDWRDCFHDGNIAARPHELVYRRCGLFQTGNVFVKISNNYSKFDVRFGFGRSQSAKHLSRWGGSAHESDVKEWELANCTLYVRRVEKDWIHSKLDGRLHECWLVYTWTCVNKFA